jgi:hypothetical protein
MTHLNKTMQGLSVEATPRIRARRLSERAETRIHMVAVYSSLALIAAIVCGAISLQPV